MNDRSYNEERLRDNQAYIYDEWYLQRGQYNVEIEDRAILEALNLQENERLLDLGCGTGRLLEKMSSKVESSVGLDLSGKSVEVLNSKKLPQTVALRFDITKDDITSLPGPFDKIVSVQMIQHLDPLVVPGVLRDISGVLANTGVFVLELYNYSGLNRKIEILRSRGKIKKVQNDGNDFFEYRYSPSEMVLLLKNAGFKNIQVLGVCNLPRAIVNRLGAKSFFIERILQHSWFGIFLGYYFIVRAKK